MKSSVISGQISNYNNISSYNDFKDDNKNYILIVEDNNINKAILSKILSVYYNVVSAENGKIALQILRSGNFSFSAIMLDLIMPVMDGFTFLHEISLFDEFKSIPIIVTTGNDDRENEKKALELGAWDFVSKPYDAQIILFRIKNAIDRSQLTAFSRLKYLAEFDSLTGICNKEHFLYEVSKLVKSEKPGSFIFVRFDIYRFQLINAFFGIHEGDLLLKYIATFLSDFVKSFTSSICGRMNADVFAFCIPFSDESAVVDMVKHIKKMLKAYPLNFDIVPTFGIYLISDLSVQPDIMLDRAALAAKSIKGNYMVNYAFYNDKMRQEITTEQEITNEMNKALEDHQFTVYFQPKYDLKTRIPCGAEALVRWIHPVKGCVSPGTFIPVFERNGFVTKLDYYVWESVCIAIRKWLDCGKLVHPVSVNVSRVNLYNKDLIRQLCELTDKYNVPKELINLEITESAYTESPEILQQMTEKLKNCGFVIMMDDFGSGYSSLNILKDIDVDVLKIDMRFLSDTHRQQRSENIISSVVGMAKSLGISTIAEGVERKEQADFLASIGCDCVQGFYFARPMPIEQYEPYAEDIAL